MLFDFVKKKLGIFWSVSVLIPSQKVFARFESLLKLSSFFFLSRFMFTLQMCSHNPGLPFFAFAVFSFPLFVAEHLSSLPFECLPVNMTVHKHDTCPFVCRYMHVYIYTYILTEPNSDLWYSAYWSRRGSASCISFVLRAFMCQGDQYGCARACWHHVHNSRMQMYICRYEEKGIAVYMQV